MIVPVISCTFAMMKLLVISSSFPSEGYAMRGPFIPPLAVQFNKLGYSIQILTQNTLNAKEIQHEVCKGYDVFRFAWRGASLPVSAMAGNPLKALYLLPDYYYSAMKAAHQLISENRPDLIHAEWLLPSGYIAMKLSLRYGIPFTARALGSDVLVLGRKKIPLMMLKQVARNASALFADGFELCKKTISLAQGANCIFVPTTVCRNFLQQRQKPEKSGFHILTAGRLEKVKGQDVLLKAADILRRKGLLFTTHIVGTGSEENKLKSMIKELGIGDNIVMHGSISNKELEALYSSVHCMVIPSRSESIPMVMGEAVDARLPLVVSDVGDMAFLTRQYQLGYVFNNEDYQELAEKIGMMAISFKEITDNAQFNEASGVFSVEQAALSMSDCFQDIIRKKNQYGS